MLIPLLIGGTVNAIESEHRDRILPLVLALLGAGLLRLGLTVGRRLIAGKVSLAVEFDLRQVFYEHLQKLELAFFDSQQTGQLMSRATVDLQSIRFFLGYGLIWVSQSALTILFAAAAMIVLDPVLALLALAPVPFLVATAVNCIAAQRLVRKVGTGCAEDVDTSPQTLMQIGFAPDEVKTLKVKRGRGCESCKHTGYKGRLGLFEVLSFTDEIRDMILTGASSIELKRRAVEEGMVTLRVAGLHKIRDGVTTLEEVLRETVA